MWPTHDPCALTWSKRKKKKKTLPYYNRLKRVRKGEFFSYYIMHGWAAQANHNYFVLFCM